MFLSRSLRPRQQLHLSNSRSFLAWTAWAPNESHVDGTIGQLPTQGENELPGARIKDFQLAVRNQVNSGGRLASVLHPSDPNQVREKRLRVTCTGFHHPGRVAVTAGPSKHYRPELRCRGLGASVRIGQLWNHRCVCRWMSNNASSAVHHLDQA